VPAPTLTTAAEGWWRNGPVLLLAVRQRRPKSTSSVTCQGSYTASFPSY